MSAELEEAWRDFWNLIQEVMKVVITRLRESSARSDVFWKRFSVAGVFWIVMFVGMMFVGMGRDALSCWYGSEALQGERRLNETVVYWSWHFFTFYVRSCWGEMLQGERLDVNEHIAQRWWYSLDIEEWNIRLEDSLLCHALLERYSSLRVM